jgi:hypothetical protein
LRQPISFVRCDHKIPASAPKYFPTQQLLISRYVQLHQFISARFYPPFFPFAFRNLICFDPLSAPPILTMALARPFYLAPVNPLGNNKDCWIVKPMCCYAGPQNLAVSHVDLNSRTFSKIIILLSNLFLSSHLLIHTSLHSAETETASHESQSYPRQYKHSPENKLNINHRKSITLHEPPPNHNFSFIFSNVHRGLHSIWSHEVIISNHGHLCGVHFKTDPRGTNQDAS